MKRGALILTSLSIFSLTLLSSLKRHVVNKVNKGFKIQADDGRYHGHLTLKEVNSNITNVNVSGRDTDGAMAIFEQTSLSSGKGRPLYIHHSQDEDFHGPQG